LKKKILSVGFDKKLWVFPKLCYCNLSVSRGGKRMKIQNLSKPAIFIIFVLNQKVILYR